MELANPELHGLLLDDVERDFLKSVLEALRLSINTEADVKVAQVLLSIKQKLEVA